MRDFYHFSRHEYFPQPQASLSPKVQLCHFESFARVSLRHTSCVSAQCLLQSVSKHLGFSFWFRVCQCFHLEEEVFLLMW